MIALAASRESPGTTADVVRPGARVTVWFDDEGAAEHLVIGHASRDDAAWSVSPDAPIAGALLGARVGDRRAFPVGERMVTVTVREILSRGTDQDSRGHGRRVPASKG